MEEHCVVCGTTIPEGRQICPQCEAKYGGVNAGNMKETAINIARHHAAGKKTKAYGEA